ncbi:MAG: hypothetical protein KC468_22990, partial [Myxococcales bacterium]|nr:hypothetical protein [Myxococcales bacterium]
MSERPSPRPLGELLVDLDPTYVACGPETVVERVEVDSRRVGPGVAFLATRGVARDAHDFVAAAASAGARVLILERGRLDPEHPALRGRGVAWLADTGAAYPEIAASAHGRPGAHMRLAGVTGTNGKTTTTFLVDAMLRAAGRTFTRVGTTGNWVADRDEPAGFTTPFPLELQALLARARARGATCGVMEVSSHAL